MKEEKEQSYQLPVSVLNNVLNYLGSQKFVDVAELISSIRQTAKPVQENDGVNEPKQLITDSEEA